MGWYDHTVLWRPSATAFYQYGGDTDGVFAEEKATKATKDAATQTKASEEDADNEAKYAFEVIGRIWMTGKPRHWR